MQTGEVNQNPLNQLYRRSAELLKESWKDWVHSDRTQALALLNDPSLEFPVLFLLRDQLEVRGTDLGIRSRLALSQVDQVLLGTESAAFANRDSFPDRHDLVVGSLLWMLRTGWKNIISTDYTQVIDRTAIQILHTYHQNWIKGMNDLIFYRYRNKSQRHYLVSALLETAEPVSLVYQANYLLSDHAVESSLARRLLGFIPEVRHAEDNQAAFLAFETWYEDNGNYLVYTGENNDAVPGGIPYRIHSSAKYLGKVVQPKNGQPIQQLLPEEAKNYQNFIRLPGRTRAALADCSARFRKQNPQQWKWWIARPVREQLESISASQMGGERR
ncbi:hypothetical protein [Sporolactobacillus vineae]|uniref:hypothetical protein n=1 Tax=Sporolactobacillus vineae TaxID=444463 RepID=UPI000289950D|nr:hypothetical protein [Sporolactobacillus vineae]